MVGKVTGEEPFRYIGSNGRFVLSAPQTPYTLNYSGDGVTWTAVEDATPVGENHVVVNAPTGMFFKCAGLPSGESLIITG